MADMFKLQIISPDKPFYEGEASFLEFTSVEGEMGVYKNHIPMTTILQPAVVKIHTGEEVKKCAVIGGFVEIQGDKITILAEDAQWPGEIDPERAKEAKIRAEKRLKLRESETDINRAELGLKKAIARINAID